MTTELTPETVIAQLQQIIDDPTSTSDINSTAQAWQAILNEAYQSTIISDFDIVFIGKAGVGKTSLIGSVSQLMLDKPTDKASLQKYSVLSVASGRTTLCEVEICNNFEGNLELQNQPFSRQEMEQEIRLYAEEVFHRYNKSVATENRDDEQNDDNGQELQRAICNLTDYAEKTLPFIDTKGKQKWRPHFPIRDAVNNFDSKQAFAEHLIARAKLDNRIQTTWQRDDLAALKQLFHAINSGNEATACLPKKLTLKVPNFIPAPIASLNLKLIDTRGIDGVVESRKDIREHLKNPKALFVLCSSFNAAPDAEIRTLLRIMTDDAELQTALSRTMLVLLDWDDAGTVNNANGDRLLGQDFKVEECLTVLESAGLSQHFDTSNSIAFDVINDERHRFTDELQEQIRLIHERQVESLNGYINQSLAFINSAKSLEINSKRAEFEHKIDSSLLAAMQLYIYLDAPVKDPLQGLYSAINASYYASPVYASCRRNGNYYKLNFYTAIETSLSLAVTSKLNPLFDAINNALEGLKTDKDYQFIEDVISLKQKQYQDAKLKVQRDYVEKVYQQVSHELKSAAVWQLCCDEWGRKVKEPGFKIRILDILQKWSIQRAFSEHMNIALNSIPLFKQLFLAHQAPKFTLVVRNLLALKKVDWQLESPVSILIGANGVGKSTLLDTFLFLNLAYHIGLAFAIPKVYGSTNIKNWDSDEEASIEVGLNVDNIRWRIAIISLGVTRISTYESLYVDNELIYSYDSLGDLIYQGDRILFDSEPEADIGLRILKNRGFDHPAIQQIVSFLLKISHYKEPDLVKLRDDGCKTADNSKINVRGDNALTLLRRWHQEKANEHRYAFVIDGLSAAFPNIFGSLDFVEAGQSLSARVYRPNSERPNPLYAEANGLIQLLILFCEIAAAEEASLITIDEPENALHPYALRAFWRHTCYWAEKYHLTIILATHSTVLLDELTGKPEQIYVLKSVSDDTALPGRLDKIRDREWLSYYEYGDLYEDGEIGSNGDND